MAHDSQTPPAPHNARILVDAVAKRYGLTRDDAARLTARFIDRARRHTFAPGWWVDLVDAQFQTHLGPHPRVRCGDETNPFHLTPDEGELCHDCGCAAGEYHVFGCDAEECSHCGGQAFCCDCDDDTAATPVPDSPLTHD